MVTKGWELKLWHRKDEISENWLPTVVGIGKFDGVHLGHQALLSELVDAADEQGLTPVVLTFDRNPLQTLKPEISPPALTGPQQRLNLLEQHGVAAVLELAFDSALAALPAREFVEQYLVHALQARTVVIGEGFRFGAGGLGSVDLLRELALKFGFRVREVPSVNLAGVRVSSSEVRRLLEAGEVSAASVLLGRNHETMGLVEHGRKLGRTIGFPTANLSRTAEGMLPSDGVYAGWLWVDGTRFPAAHSVGTNDSVGEVPRLVESHVIGRDDLDLYGKTVKVEYVAKVRGWSKFDSMEALVHQIGADVTRASELLAEIAEGANSDVGRKL